MVDPPFSSSLQIPFAGFSLPFHQIQDLNLQKILAKDAFDAGCRHFCVPKENINSILGERGDIFVSTKINAAWGNEKMLKNGGKGWAEMNLDLVFVEMGNANWKQRKKEMGRNVVIEMDGENLGAKKQQKPIDRVLDVWGHLEGIVRESGRIGGMGLCGKLRAEEVEKIHKKAAMKPKCWMIGLKQLVEDFEKIREMGERLDIRLIIWMENGIGNICGRGEGWERGPVLHNLMRECAKKYSKTVLNRWLFELGMALVLPASMSAKRMAEQINIFDFEICPEDRKRLEGIFTGGSGRQMPSSPYKWVNYYFGHLIHSNVFLGEIIHAKIV